MDEQVRITAAFAVTGGTAGFLTLSREEFEAVRERGPQALVDLVTDRADVGLSLCHQCAHDISDPTVEEMTGFTVEFPDGSEIDFREDGQEYQS